MKTVTKYQTIDSAEHDSKDAATKYLHTLYSEKLCPLANRLANIDAYGPMMDYINNNLNLFIELAKIKNDMIVTDSDEPDTFGL